MSDSNVCYLLGYLHTCVDEEQRGKEDDMFVWYFYKLLLRCENHFTLKLKPLGDFHVFNPKERLHVLVLIEENTVSVWL